MKTKAQVRHILASIEKTLDDPGLPAHVRVPIRNAAVLMRLALSLLNRHADEPVMKGHD